MKFVISLFFLAVVNSTPLKPKANPQDYRLPAYSVDVENYNLHLRLQANVFQTNEFSGEVTIRFTNKNTTSNLKLHANKITFTTGQVTLQELNGEDVTNVAVTNLAVDNVTDVLTLSTDSNLKQNVKYRLAISYTGKLRTDEMYGFYKSSYVNENNQEVFLGTTQFQPTHARKAFPCFDEPIYKASFDIKITHPDTLNALGNTQGTVAAAEAGFNTTTFATTPRMSTYLVAFVVSDFTCSSSTGASTDTPHRICSRQETQPLRETAVEAGPKLIKALENITGISYLDSKIGKMDQVAIPDFSAGAMENWGLLTYRETNLLWDPERSSNSYLQSIKNVVSHEITHMWFGDLVTCHWWSDTFLNEGFARLYQYYGTAEIEPSWQLEKQFVTAQIHPMLVTDAQPGATALSHEVYTQNEISGRFGSVSYNKGASIYRMVRNVMGVSSFNSGLNAYLDKFKFQTTTPEDLWTSLQQNVTNNALPPGTTLAQVMENWVKKPGFPLLNVHVAGNEVHVSQNRFVISGTPSDEDKWYVPIAYTLSTDANLANRFQDTTTRAWLLPNSTLTINIPEGPEWIILNNQQTGFYRVQYDDATLAKIEAVLKENHQTIDEINRAHLVDDVYNLARIDTYTYEKLFEFLRYLQKETSYYPWNAAITAFSNMLQRTGNEKIRRSLSDYILVLIEEVYKSVPFETAKDDDQIYTYNRVQVVTWACRLGNKNCIDKAVAAFQAYKNNSAAEVDKNLKTSIYCNGLRHSTDPDDWEFLWGKYQATKLASEKVTILNTLGCSLDENVLNRYLNLSITKDSGIKQQDALTVFSSVYTQNYEGVDYALDFLLKNHQAIADYYGSMNSLNNLFSGLAARFTVQAQVTKLENFLKNTPDLPDSVITAGNSAVTTAKANLVWTEAFEKQLSVYFELDTGTADRVKIGFTTVVVSIFMVLYQTWF